MTSNLLLLTGGTGIADSITEIIGWVGDVIGVLTTPPLSYFLAASLITVVIGIFATGKRSVG